MRKKLKNAWILLLTALAALLVLAGCSFGVSLESLKEDYNLTAQVTYYANGEFAKFAPNNEKEKDIYYSSNSPVFEITEESGKIQIGYEKYLFDGWYHIATDDDGKLIESGEYEYEGEVFKLYQLGEKVDFSKRIQEGEHWKIAAKWKRDIKVQVQFVYEADAEREFAVDSSAITDKENPLFGKTSIKTGETLFFEEFDNYSKVTEKYLEGSMKKIKFSEADPCTALAYYTDPACTQLLEGDIEALPNQEEDTVIYAKFIEGKWSVVKTSDDVKSMMTNLYSGERYYLFNDIDYTGAALKPSNFGAELQGNGHTIRGLKFVVAQENTTYSIFRDIRATAIMENVSFEDVSLDINMHTQSTSHYFVCNSIADGAVVNNVSVQGKMTIAVTLEETKIENMKDGFDKALFGGFENDAAYYAQYPGGFTVVGNPAEFIEIIRNY
ncbi:MAG: hypothetical protein IJF44_02840 [Clostridia bacterium]|nr:hypothetical protein [Clostridia bacterium]